MSSRTVYLIAGLMTFTALFVCFAGVPLIWDGAYQLVISLRDQEPFKHVTRFHSWLLWLPTVIASKYSDNRTLLTVLYGLPFMLSPVVGVLASWSFLRRTAPHLMIWVVFGICIGPLPGQVFVINDSIFQMHLFWPIFIAAFVPLTRWQWLAWGCCLIFAYSHPIGLPMLLGTALGVLLLARYDPASRPRHLRRAALYAGLTALAIAKFILLPKLFPQLTDHYVHDEMTLLAMAQRWVKGVAGWAIYGLLFMWASAVLAYIAGRSQSAANRSRLRISGVAAALGAACWIWWAIGDLEGRLWWGALDYRRWVVPLTLPFYVLAYLELIRGVVGQTILSGVAGASGGHSCPPETLRDPDSWRNRLGLTLGIAFTLVLCLQSIVWMRLWNRVETQVAQSPPGVLNAADFAWARRTPLHHWGLNAQVIFMQGKTTRNIIIAPREWNRVPVLSGQVPLTEWDYIRVQPGPAGYFDTSLIQEDIRRKTGSPTTQTVDPMF